MTENTNEEYGTRVRRTVTSVARSMAVGIAMAASTVVAATAGHAAADIAGLPPNEQAVIEGVAGTLALVAVVYYAFVDRAEETESIPAPSTDVPDPIDSNDYMTVISNAPNDLGLAVWNKDEGAAIMDFHREGIVDEVWITDDEIDDVTDALEHCKTDEVFDDGE